MLLLLLSPALLVPECVSGEENGRVGKIKAAHIYHLTKFAKWPSEAFPDESATLRFCTIGETAINEYITEIVKVGTVQQKRLEARFLAENASVKELGECHTLYFGKMEKRRAEEALASVIDKPILTISERADSLSTIIRLFEEKNKLRVGVSRKSAGAARITISSELLVLATMED